MIKNILKMLREEWKLILKATVGCGIIIFTVLFTFFKVVEYFNNDSNVVETEQIINDNRNTNE